MLTDIVTKGLSLEQIAAKFGDDVVDNSGHRETAKEFIQGDAATVVEVEDPKA
jgi:hypothetical protein